MALPMRPPKAGPKAAPKGLEPANAERMYEKAENGYNSLMQNGHAPCVGLGGIGGGPLGSFQVAGQPEDARPYDPWGSGPQPIGYNSNGKPVGTSGSQHAGKGYGLPIAPPPTRLTEGGPPDYMPPPGAGWPPAENGSPWDYPHNASAMRREEEEDAEDVVFGAAVVDAPSSPYQQAIDPGPPREAPPPRRGLPRQPQQPPPSHPPPPPPSSVAANGYSESQPNPKAPPPAAVQAEHPQQMNGFSANQPNPTGPPPPMQATQPQQAPQPQRCSFIAEKDGMDYCLLCSAFADDWHLQSKKHLKRAERPEWYLWDEDEQSTSAASSFATATGQAPPPQPPAYGSHPQQPPSVAQQPEIRRTGAANGGAAGKTCSWCKQPAVERAVEGTKARYCAECWDWWLKEQAAPAAPKAANGSLAPPGLPPPVRQTAQSPGQSEWCPEPPPRQPMPKQPPAQVPREPPHFQWSTAPGQAPPRFEEPPDRDLQRPYAAASQPDAPIGRRTVTENWLACDDDTEIYV